MKAARSKFIAQKQTGSKNQIKGVAVPHELMVTNPSRELPL